MAKQRKNMKIPFFLGNKWKPYLKKINIDQEKNWLPVHQEKKEILILNKSLKSKLSPFFFKPWIKHKKISWTKRQKYLNKLYMQYRKKFSLKKRKNFLKTVFGEILKTTLLNSEIKKGLWLSARVILRAKRIKQLNRKRFYLKKIPWSLVKPHGKQYEILRNSMQKGWLYEQLLKGKLSRNAKHFVLDRPKTAFQNHYKQQKKEPWVDALLFQRWAYFGFIEKYKKETKKRKLKIKDYLRKWNPRFQKRNQLYWWRRKLLFDFYRKNVIKKDKTKRIKQVLGKIYFPFYGQLKQKQFNTILGKKKKIKSRLFSKNETILSSLENRLDVVVYRLNLAPNILWARRLILEGSIFVNNIFSFSTWTAIYSQFKHLSFPLKLRDPKNLYKMNFWDPNNRISKFKFLLKPTKKIHYLVKPGDLIQSAKSLSINKFKNNKRLLRKPIPKHLYTRTKTKFKWNNAIKAPEVYSAKKWRDPKQQITASIFLFNPRFTDLHINGRIQELFFRWMTL
jgi:ribosomal protein S4